MTEYRIKSIESSLLRAELAAACEALRQAEVKAASVSFGWDSNLPIEEMWKERSVPIDEVIAFIAESERSGVSQLGKSDVFVETPGFLVRGWRSYRRKSASALAQAWASMDRAHTQATRA